MLGIEEVHLFWCFDTKLFKHKWMDSFVHIMIVGVVMEKHWDVLLNVIIRNGGKEMRGEVVVNNLTLEAFSKTIQHLLLFVELLLGNVSSCRLFQLAFVWFER